MPSSRGRRAPQNAGAGFLRKAVSEETFSAEGSSLGQPEEEEEEEEEGSANRGTVLLLPYSSPPAAPLGARLGPGKGAPLPRVGDAGRSPVDSQYPHSPRAGSWWLIGPGCCGIAHGQPKPMGELQQAWWVLGRGLCLEPDSSPSPPKAPVGESN